MPLSLVTPPSSEPLASAAVRAQLRWTSTDEDAFVVGQLIPAARERGENATLRQFGQATWDLFLNAFPTYGGRELIELPRPPLRSVTHIKYYDQNGTLQTWDPANYIVQAPTGERCSRGIVTPAYGVVWPDTQDRIGAVQIRFVCGYDSVPPLLLTAMLMDIGGLWEFREDMVAQGAAPVEVPSGSRSIYRQYKSRARYALPGMVD
jgi:uncharacterized phiE125 gp8 family phage protein